MCIGKVIVLIGAQPLPIDESMIGYDELTAEELKTCGILRIYPEQYLEIKRTMLYAVVAYGRFKKREAQTWFRIDVNKVFMLIRFVSFMIGLGTSDGSLNGKVSAKQRKSSKRQTF